MISLFYNQSTKTGVVFQNGMPMLVITDEAVLDFELYAKEATVLARQVGKSSAQRTAIDAFLRCPDEELGWKKL